MDLLEQTIKHLMSKRERKGWQLQEHQKETVLIIKFKPERRHFDSDDSECTEPQTDFKPSRVTYKRKSEYQTKRDFKRSVGLVQKYDEIRNDSKKSDSKQHSSPSGDLATVTPGVTPSADQASIPVSVTEHVSDKKHSQSSTSRDLASPEITHSAQASVPRSVPATVTKHANSSALNSMLLDIDLLKQSLKSSDCKPDDKSSSPAKHLQESLKAVEELILKQEALEMERIKMPQMTNCFYCRDKLPPDPSEVCYEDSGGVQRQFCANLCKQMFENDYNEV